jgi:membrane protease YdiL (CAAX protease family)
MLKVFFSFFCILTLNYLIFRYNLESYFAILISIGLYVLLFFWLSKPTVEYNLNTKFLKLGSYSLFILFSVFLLVSLNYSLTIFLNILVFDKFPIFSISNISLLNSLYVFLLAPFFEESIFRGKIQKYLEFRINHNAAIILSSILFTLVHIFSNSGLIWIFASSIFIGYVYHKSRNIYLVITIHSFTNIVSHYLSNFDFFGSYNDNSNSFFIISIIGLILSLIGLIGLYHFRDRIYNLFLSILKELFFNRN